MKTVYIHILSVGSLQTNCYVLTDSITQKGIIIDPGDDAEYISDYIEKEKIKITGIYATHGHFDHIMAAFALQSMYNIPFFIHSKDQFLVDHMMERATYYLKLTYCDPPPTVSEYLDEKKLIQIGSVPLPFIHTPGHTPGSVTYILQDNKSLIVGDVLFADGRVGRTDFVYSSKKDLKVSIQTIFAYDPEYEILPGHGETCRIREIINTTH